MRRAALAVLCLMLVLSLTAGVSAATAASGSTLTATVSSNGSCMVTMELQLRVEAAVSDLSFPLPTAARSITVNGSSARTGRSGDTLQVRLSSVVGNLTGNIPIRLQYTLPGIVDYDDAGKLILTLPMLSGFHYPIEKLDFSITLPGSFDTKPNFSSGYYQQTIETNINYTVSGGTISGTVGSELKDRETLVMTLEVNEDLFPQNPVRQWHMGVEEVIMIAVSVLAVVYWIVFLRSAPYIARRSTVPPEGYTAGELSGLLCGQGNDLTMMVFSWAQMGYILIHLQDSGRVTLHKRMEMGNERDPEEVRLYNNLFGKRRYIDGTGYHYANLYRRAAASTGNARDLYRRSSGNPKIFRGLCAFIGLLGGISLGRAIAGDALLGILLIAILAVLGALSAWIMQEWVRGLHLRDRFTLLLSLGLCAAWVLLGAMSGILNVTACVAGAQLLCGLACAYGGRRTALGRQILSQTLGFRRYLKTLHPKDAQRISRADPDYFFDMAPYALALGISKPFGKSFRGKRMSACPYLTTGMDGHLTAEEWCQTMERAAHALDHRQKRLFLERLTGK